MARSAPTGSRERIETVDILRGFALLGVVLANFQHLISWENLAGTSDGTVALLIEHLVGGKFYRLFAFLFGVGFALQMTRLESRGVRFVPLYMRRLGILFIIGIVHGILFWPNDILALFAQFGLLLLLIRRASNRSLFIIAVGCLFASNIYYYLSTDFADFRQVVIEQQDGPGDEQRAQEDAARNAETERVRSQGDFPEIVAWNAAYFWDWHTDIRAQLAILGEEFLMFICGIYAVRCRVFERPDEAGPFIRRVMLWSLGVALASYPVIETLSSGTSHPVYGHLAISARVVMRDIQPAALSLFYASALTLLLYRTAWKRRLWPLARFGRMALTHYLALSVIVTTIFFGYGFGLYGKVGVTTGVGISIVTGMLMILFSTWWMDRYRFGPVEWVWRSLTYRHRQELAIRE